MLYGPCRSGKTSLVHHVLATLESGEEPVPTLFVTLQEIRDQLLAGESWSAMNALLADTFSEVAFEDGDVEVTALSKASWLRDMVMCGRVPSPPVLVIDKFDVVLECPEQVRGAILSGLQAFVGPARHDRVVRGIILCGTYRMTALGMDTRTKVPMSLVSFAEVRAMFDTYQEEWWSGSVTVADEVVEDIVTDTGGHKGWTMLAAVRVHSAIKHSSFSGGVLRLEDWQAEKSHFEDCLMASVYLGKAVRFASGHGSEHVQAILRAVGHQVPTDDNLLDVCRHLVTWGVLTVDEDSGGEGGSPVRLGAPVAVRLVRTALEMIEM